MFEPVRRLPLLVFCLALGQTAGWGTTYYMPSVLAPALARDLGLDATGMYLGVTIMVGLGGLDSPPAGRLLDTHGAARFLPVGPLAIGLGPLLIATFPTVAMWYAAWALFGVGMAFGLTLAVNTFLSRFVGRAARRQIGIVALLAGFAPTLFWPLTAVLEARFGWRGTLAIYAGLELLVILPLQLWIGHVWPDRTAVPDDEDTGTHAQPAPAPLSPRTRTIAIVAMVIALGIGLPLGIIAGLKPGGLSGKTIMSGSILGFSLPNFWIGLMLISIFAVQLKWLPSGGRGPTVDVFGIPLSILSLEGLKYLILPAFTLATYPISLTLRMTRAAMVEVLGEKYIVAARAQGLPERDVLFRYALKNAIVPALNVLGLSFAFSLTGSFLVEVIFSWPGLGKYVTDSILNADFPVIVSVTLVVTVFYVLINLAVDLIQARLDPRVVLR